MAIKLTKVGAFPVEITFVIENPDEMRELWHRLNISSTFLKNAYGSISNFDYDFRKSHDVLNKLWVAINDHMEKHGVKP